MYSSFLTLLPDSDPDCPLFIGDKGGVTAGRFKTDVQRYYPYFDSLSSPSVALYIPDDNYLFYILLMAALHAGKDIVLLSNTNPQTMAAISSVTDSIVTREKAPVPLLNTPLPELPPIQDNRLISFFTSGSTNTPKCIHKKLKMLLDEVKTHSVMQEPLICQNPVVLSSIEPFHMYGMLWRCLFALCNHLVQDLDNIFYPEELQHKQALYDKVIFLSTPSFFNEIVAYRNQYTYSDNCIGIFSSGSLLSPDTSQAMYDMFHCSPFEIYGSTETGGVAYRQQKESNVFYLFPKVCITCQHNGCLSVSSPYSITSPYDTADKITLLTESTFQLEGRIDRMVKIAEKRVSLPEMEEHLMNNPAIKTVYLLTKEETKRTILIAFLTLTDKGKQDLMQIGRIAFIGEIKSYLKKWYDNSLLPRKFRIMEKIPTNAQGKLIKSELLHLVDSKLQEPIMLSPLLTHDTFASSLFFEAGAPYFKGHFPNLPILPGVIQLAFAIHFIRMYFRVTPVNYTISKLKFSSLLLPGNPVSFTLTKLSNTSFTFIYQSEDKIFSSGKISWEDS